MLPIPVHLTHQLELNPFLGMLSYKFDQSSWRDLVAQDISARVSQRMVASCPTRQGFTGDVNVMTILGSIPRVVDQVTVACVDVVTFTVVSMAIHSEPLRILETVLGLHYGHACLYVEPMTQNVCEICDLHLSCVHDSDSAKLHIYVMIIVIWGYEPFEQIGFRQLFPLYVQEILRHFQLIANLQLEFM